MDELDSTILELMEVVTRGATKAKAEKLQRPLTMAMRRAFNEQGAMFVRKLRVLKIKFAEASRIVGNVPDDGPFHIWAAQLQMEFREAITPADWQRAWYEVEQATIKLIALPIDKAVAEALRIGALAQIGSLGMDVRFDLKNPRALAYLNQYGARQVTKINETTRGILQTLLSQAADEGWSYQRTADAIIERFAEFGIGKPQDHIDSRAHLIAVTEVGNAYAEGNLIVAKDLAEAGILTEKYWDTVGDTKVSQGCKDNEAAGWIAFDAEFPSGHQRPLRFPGCRCDLLIRVKE